MNFKHTHQLNSQIYRDALSVRQAVFIEEQQIDPALEIDANEAQAIHFVGYHAALPVVTARLLTEPGGYHVQRVATLKAYRHQQRANALFRELIAYARTHQQQYLILGAQDHALGFYQQLGFHQTKRPGFLDAGIPHHEMRLDLV